MQAKKVAIILLLWVAAEIIQAFTLQGARTGLVLFLMATALLYHRMIKPLTVKFLIISGSSLFIFFIFLGLYRAYIDFASLQTDLSQVDAGIFPEVTNFRHCLERPMMYSNER